MLLLCSETSYFSVSNMKNRFSNSPAVNSLSRFLISVCRACRCLLHLNYEVCQKHDLYSCFCLPVHPFFVSHPHPPHLFLLVFHFFPNHRLVSLSLISFSFSFSSFAVPSTCHVPFSPFIASISPSFSSSLLTHVTSSFPILSLLLSVSHPSSPPSLFLPICYSLSLILALFPFLRYNPSPRLCYQPIAQFCWLTVGRKAFILIPRLSRVTGLVIISSEKRRLVEGNGLCS